MKKVLLLIITLFIGSIVRATELTVENNIISFPEPDDYVMQGFATVKDKLFITLIHKKETHSLIKVYDLNDYSLYKDFSFQSIGHANDITYNNKTNEILVLHGGGTKTVSLFDGDTFEFKDKITVPLPIRGISYVPEEDLYIVKTVNSGFRLNSDYSLKSIVPFVTAMDYTYDNASQGWTYYNGYIYHANWSWIRRGGDGTNTVFVYDYNGHLKDKLVTANDVGELEDIDFYNDKMILGLRGYDKITRFYLEDIPIIPEPIIEDEEVKELTVEQKKNNSTAVRIIGWLVVLSATYILSKKLQ